ncbi:Uncharacterised protein [Vibrio cholerae]|nr:Uncharacterised protein [Vibrio cholerae]
MEELAASHFCHKKLTSQSLADFSKFHHIVITVS